MQNEVENFCSLGMRTVTPSVIKILCCCCRVSVCNLLATLLMRASTQKQLTVVSRIIKKQLSHTNKYAYCIDIVVASKSA